MSEDTLEPLIIDLSDQTPLRFNGTADISNWLNQEQQAFAWLQKGGARAGGATQNLASTYIQTFSNLRQTFNTWTANPKDDRLKTQLVNQIQSFYNNRHAVRSDHPSARIASEINARDGAVAASAAFGFLLGHDCQLNYETLGGLVSARLLRDGVAPKSPELVAKALADLDSAAKSQISSNAIEWDRLAATCQAQLISTEEEFKKQTSNLNSATDQTFKRVNESVDASLKSIRTTEETYKEQMKLQAPVDYWQDKAEKHAKALKNSRLTLVSFATLGSAVLVCTLLYVTTLASSVAEKSTGETAILLKYAAVGIVITTIAFWVGRVLLRIYLSDRHLLTDAEERIALIKTYLALSNDSKVEATDRALVLAPLFRTAADGIVKEEGPDASIAGIIAKALESKGGR